MGIMFCDSISSPLLPLFAVQPLHWSPAAAAATPPLPLPLNRNPYVLRFPGDQIRENIVAHRKRNYFRLTRRGRPGPNTRPLIVIVTSPPRPRQPLIREGRGPWLFPDAAAIINPALWPAEGRHWNGALHFLFTLGSPLVGRGRQGGRMIYKPCFSLWTEERQTPKVFISGSTVSS